MSNAVGLAAVKIRLIASEASFRQAQNGCSISRANRTPQGPEPRCAGPWLRARTFESPGLLLGGVNRGLGKALRAQLTTFLTRSGKWRKRQFFSVL